MKNTITAQDLNGSSVKILDFDTLDMSQEYNQPTGYIEGEHVHNKMCLALDEVARFLNDLRGLDNASDRFNHAFKCIENKYYFTDFGLLAEFKERATDRMQKENRLHAEQIEANKPKQSDADFILSFAFPTKKGRKG